MDQGQDVVMNARLTELALDVSLTSSHESSRLWGWLNPALWRATRNAWAVLQTASGELKKIESDPSFRSTLDAVTHEQSLEDVQQRWFGRIHPHSPLTTIAYFSMEFMLTEALPIYSGGLGNVAGDQLKAANDLGVPVVGVGLLYSQGYFRQELDRNGAQLALYPFNDPGQLPLQPVLDSNGDRLRFTIPFPGCDLWLRAWEAKVGRTRLLLLDTNDLANFPEYRCITTELYGGGPDLRLRQELVLGIGGWRVLRALGIRPEVCHLNEGHAAFAILERAASFMEDQQVPFDVALAATRAGNLFTTHTPVEAGFDLFRPEAMYPYFERYCAHRLQITFGDLLALGRRDAHNASESFNMAFLAMRGSGAVNGVSRLHGAVSRALFQPLFPRWPTGEVPVAHVTNGIHVPTWEHADAERLWAERCGARCWSGETDHGEAIRGIDDARLWSFRNAARTAMIAHIRHRYARQVAMQGGSQTAITAAAAVFHSETLTLGFARRFAAYKRPNLLLHDRSRLTRILTDANRPVQLVIAGKAHPQDFEGQEMIREWTAFLRESRVPAIFLSDYEMALTQELAGGVDVWINTPRRPWEASGTSGMKLLVNGGLNLSELDGWWAEAFTPEVGWALGDGREHDPSFDAFEAEELYTILEQQVIPEFYDRDAAGLPQRWLARVRESMARLTPAYSASRVVREYTEKYYLPAAAAFAARAADHVKLATQIRDWQSHLDQAWDRVRFGPLNVKSENARLYFEVHLDLAGIDPAAVRVELFADGVPPLEMHHSYESLYTADVPANRSANDFTPRVVPRHPAASIPLEANHILWQK